jgi:hypothetical protein
MMVSASVMDGGESGDGDGDGDEGEGEDDGGGTGAGVVCWGADCGWPAVAVAGVAGAGG